MAKKTERINKLQKETNYRLLKTKAILLEVQLQIIKMKASVLKARIQALKDMALIGGLDSQPNNGVR